MRRGGRGGGRSGGGKGHLQVLLLVPPPLDLSHFLENLVRSTIFILLHINWFKSLSYSCERESEREIVKNKNRTHL